MTGQQSRSASSHVRAVVVQSIDDVAIPARFRAIVDALLARVVGFPTTGGGAFLPVDVAGVALPAIGDAATPAHAPERGVAWPVRAAGLTAVANERVPAPERRVFLATPFRDACDRNYRECHAIRDGFDAGPGRKPLRQCRRCRPIAVG